LYFAKSIRSGSKMETDRFGSDIESSPLSQRAWTYQEQVLSRRTLYFAESQLYWERDHCRLSEDNSPQAHTERGYPVLTLVNALTTVTRVKWYEGAVQTYSKRQLTYQSDKLTAISAVAKATHLHHRLTYVAGLWGDSLIRGLGWYRDGPGKKDRVVPCPSWSWASQQSGVSYMGSVSESVGNSPTSPKIMSFHVETDEINPFGNVPIDQVTLRTMVTTGQIMPGQHRSQTDGCFKWYDDDKSLLIVKERTGLEKWTAWAVLDDDGNQGQNVTVAFLSDWNRPQTMWKLLLLEQASEQEDAYKRVGIGLIGQDYLTYDGRFDTQDFRRE
jgi:hypothetical protein